MLRVGDQPGLYHEFKANLSYLAKPCLETKHDLDKIPCRVAVQELKLFQGHPIQI